MRPVTRGKLARLTGLARSVYILCFLNIRLHIRLHSYSPHCRDPGCFNSAAERFAHARRQCAQLRKRAGNYRVIYIGPKVPHNFPYLFTETPLKL